MITMHNVLKHGRTVWDRALLPEDEYVERAAAVRAAAEASGLDFVIGVGHSSHPGNFTYLSGNVPPLGWMAWLIGREAGPVLISGGGSRDLPFLRTQTWIDDLRTSHSLFAGPAEAARAVLDEVAQPSARVGLLGAREDLSASAHGELLSALAAYQVSEVDGLLAPLRAAKRPRELAALRRSLEIAREAASAAVRAWEGGASTSAAGAEAERAAHLRGARDVRVLANLDGEHLSPIERQSDQRGPQLALFCAVEHSGYWGQTCAATPEPGPRSAARLAVAAMLDAAGPGGRASDLVAAATAVLPGRERDVALSYGVGAGLGLDPAEAPLIASGASDLLPVGGVVGLQAITLEERTLSCWSETIRIDGEGITRL
jgi:Xaa-Pro aminopeptidase